MRLRASHCGLASLLLLLGGISASIELTAVPLRRRHAGSDRVTQQFVFHGETPVATYLYGSLNSTFEYVAAIELGSSQQTFIVQVDTGSVALAVPAAGCKEWASLQQPTSVDCGHADAFYDPSQSTDSARVPCSSGACQASSCGSDNNCLFGLAYADHSFLLGNMISDDFAIAGLKAKVRFDAITAESASFSRTTVDGIMGLAFQQLDAYNGDDVFGRLVQAGQCADSFSMCLGYAGGVLTLGGFNPAYSLTPPVYTPLVEQTYYVVNMTDLLLNGTSLGLSAASYVPAIVDSGTTLLAMPTDVVNQIIGVMQQTACTRLSNWKQQACYPDSQGNSLFTPGLVYPSITVDDVRLFPTLSVVLQGTGPLPLSPEQYWLQLPEGWTFGIQPLDGDGIILGDVFMHAYNVHFDRANARVGFATVTNCSGPVPTLTVYGGDGQTSYRTVQQANPIQVQVTFESGVKGVGQLITFEDVTDGHGSGDVAFSNVRAVADSGGLASTSVTLNVAGETVIKAYAMGQPSTYVLFHLHARPLSPMQIVGIAAGGCGAFALIVAVVAVCVWRCRRKKAAMLAARSDTQRAALLDDYDQSTA